MNELIFLHKCSGHQVILGDFATGLAAAMHKKRAKAINPDVSLRIAWEVAKLMQEYEPTCFLQLCTWHAVEAIKTTR